MQISIKQIFKSIVIAHGVGFSIFLGLIVATAVYLRMTTVSLDIFIPQIENLAHTPDSPITMKVDHLFLQPMKSWRVFEAEARNIVLQNQSATLNPGDKPIELLGIDHAFLEFDWFDLLKGHLSISKLRIEDIDLAITRNEAGGYSVVGLSGGISSSSEDSSQSLALKLLLQDLKNRLSHGKAPLLVVKNAKIKYQDANLTQSFSVENLNAEIFVTDVGTLQGNLEAVVLHERDLVQPIKIDLNCANTPNRLACVAGLNAKNINLPPIKKLWPPQLAIDARSWIVENIHGGIADSLDIQLGFGLAEEFQFLRLSGHSSVKKLDLTYLPKQPKITDISANLEFSDSMFLAKIAEANINQVKISSGSVLIGSKPDHKTWLDIDAELSGPIETVLKALNADPINLSQILPLKLSSENISGDITGLLKLSISLSDDQNSNSNNLLVNVKTKLKDVTIPDLLWQQSLDHSSGTIDFTLGKTSTETTVNLDQIRLHDPWQRATGNASVHVQAKQSPKGGQLTVNADLKNAALKIPEIAWIKAPGIAADLTTTIQMRSKKQAWILENLLLSVPNGGAKIHGTLATDARPFEELVIDRFDFNHTSLRGNLRFSNPKTLAINAVGKSCDIDLKHFTSSTPSEAANAAHINKKTKQNGDEGIDIHLFIERINGLRLEPLTEGNGDALIQDFSGKAKYDARLGWVSAKFHGVLPPSGLIDLELTENPAQLVLESDDAGKTLRMLGMKSKLESGNLRIQSSIKKTADSMSLDAGEIQIEGFKILDAPVLAQILAIGSYTALLNTLSNKGILFDFFHSKFSFNKNILQVKDAEAVGANLGLTIREGTADFNTKQSKFSGLILPLKQLSAGISRIPLAGKIFIGEKGDGFLGMDYHVEGPLEDPEVRINPVSGLTPNFLQMIFPSIKSFK